MFKFIISSSSNYSTNNVSFPTKNRNITTFLPPSPTDLPLTLDLNNPKDRQLYRTKINSLVFYFSDARCVYWKTSLMFFAQKPLSFYVLKKAPIASTRTSLPTFNTNRNQRTTPSSNWHHFGCSILLTYLICLNFVSHKFPSIMFTGSRKLPHE